LGGAARKKGEDNERVVAMAVPLSSPPSLSAALFSVRGAPELARLQARATSYRASSLGRHLTFWSTFRVCFVARLTWD
jgi:hypothetical protein